jgi:hypothetical protein
LNPTLGQNGEIEKWGDQEISWGLNQIMGIWLGDIQLLNATF